MIKNRCMGWNNRFNSRTKTKVNWVLVGIFEEDVDLWTMMVYFGSFWAIIFVSSIISDSCLASETCWFYSLVWMFSNCCSRFWLASWNLSSIKWWVLLITSSICSWEAYIVSSKSSKEWFGGFEAIYSRNESINNIL